MTGISGKSGVKRISFAMTGLALLSLTAGADAVTVTVNTAGNGVVIDGFGGFGGMNPVWGSGPTYNDAFLSLLVDSLGCTLMRTSVDPMPQDSVILYTKYLPYWKAMAAKAKQSGESFNLYASAWTAPANLKTTGSVTGGWVDAAHQAAYGDYLAHEVKRYSDYIGVPLLAVSPVNEPAICPGYYSMCAVPGDVGDLYLGVGRQYKTHADVASKTPLSCNDQIFALGWMEEPFVTRIETDPSVDSIVKIASGHYGAGYCPDKCDYGDGVNLSTVDKNKREYQHFYNLVHDPKRPWRRAWNTEFGGVFDSWVEDQVDETGARPGGAWSLATMYFQCLQFDLSAVIYWQICEEKPQDPKTDHYAMFHPGTAANTFELGPRFHVSKQFFRYLRPGAIKTGCASSDTANVWALAYKHAAQQTLTILLMNRSTSQQTVTVSGSNLPASFDIYQTSPNQNCVKTGTVAPGGTVTLPVKSLTTLYNTPVRTSVLMPATRTATGSAAASRTMVFGLNGRIAAPAAGRGIQVSAVKGQDGSVKRRLASAIGSGRTAE